MAYRKISFTVLMVSVFRIRNIRNISPSNTIGQWQWSDSLLLSVSPSLPPSLLSWIWAWRMIEWWPPSFLSIQPFLPLCSRWQILLPDYLETYVLRRSSPHIPRPAPSSVLSHFLRTTYSWRASWEQKFREFTSDTSGKVRGHKSSLRGEWFRGRHQSQMDGELLGRIKDRDPRGHARIGTMEMWQSESPNTSDLLSHKRFEVA